jgi:hypothetical protein
VEGDAIAFTESTGRGLTDDRTCDLMSEDPRAGQEPLLDLLDVGPADTARVHADQHLGGARLGHRDVLYP